MSEPDAAIVEALASITDRTDGEKRILLMLRHGNSLAKECVLIANRLGWVAQKLDWRTLFADGLIKREGKHSFIVLTPNGLYWQQRIAWKMAEIAGLHYLATPGEDRFNLTVRCTCGHWSARLPKVHGHLITGQSRAFAQHADAVAKGIWKKPRSVAEIFDAAYGPAPARESVGATA